MHVPVYFFFFLNHSLPFVRFSVTMAIAHPDQNAAKLELGGACVHPCLVS